MNNKIFLLIIFLIPALIQAEGLETGGEASVMVLNQFLFPQPVFYAQPVASLTLGDRLILEEQQDEWFLVTTSSGQSGWVHRTALTEKSVDLSGSGSGSGEFSAEEVTLSGRGFNSEVEADFKSRNPELNFSAVDAMEAIEITPEKLHEFLVDGNLVDGEITGETTGGGGRS